MATVTLTFANGPLKGLVHICSRPETLTLGRGRECDIKVPSSLDCLCISRHHCLLEITPPEVRVRDLGSRNGTFVNGVALGPRTDSLASPVEESLGWRALKDGDELCLGGTYLRVGIVDQAPLDAALAERATL